ncbi:hypothetical protein [Shewanella sp. MBTL60-007]|uniref:H-NS family histone-like protein n=1 Tax=Shewanella sp. MBTL60-007 TaxID=2815911 RepID=UPI001BC30EB3|nr:hypothetical protein [Shewanella sp. MBTL60-007]GIU31474.1 hypothetical protein TUM3792_43230 [Shewanella sp. MBTL60-007]
MELINAESLELLVKRKGAFNKVFKQLGKAGIKRYIEKLEDLMQSIEDAEEKQRLAEEAETKSIEEIHSQMLVMCNELNISPNKVISTLNPKAKNS